MPVAIHYAYMLPTYVYFQNRNNKSMCTLRPPKRNSALCNYRATDFYRECGGLWMLTSLLTFVGLVPALLTTHSQLHWLHTVADSWLERKFRKQRLYCLPEKKRERPVAFSYLHSPVFILLSYIYIHVKRPPSLAAI